MKSPLHILHLEDNPLDAEAVQAVLEAGGMASTITRAQGRAEFLAGLDREVDLVLADFALPGFDGKSALQLVRERKPDLPFVFVSGTIGEENAIEALKSGATDYVLKERLARLVPAVQRAMKETAEQRERKQLEAQLIEAQKMQVIGQLASGIAHDFNNILGVIMGYSDMMVQSMNAGNALRQHAVEIRHAADRAVGLTRQLLLFSRKQTLQPVVLDLNEVLDGMRKMLRRLTGENIELVMAPAKDLGRVKSDAGYVGQVLMNLAVNARDAMPDGGKLTVETANITVEETSTTLQEKVPPGRYVMLSISDTGTGMTDEVKAHLFEPFFTTKPPGKGTGLGLSTSRTIVQQSGGHIVVSSELGRGTTFKVFFPQVDQPLDAAARPASNAARPRGTATVLLVEDEPSVRHLACSILEAQGYTVLRANNGQDGLRIASQHRGLPLRLVITDVVMPKMNGNVMAEWLKASYPDLKVLFTSGYNEESIARHGVLEPGMAFLSKPYTPEALTRQVRALLDSR